MQHLAKVQSLTHLNHIICSPDSKNSDALKAIRLVPVTSNNNPSTVSSLEPHDIDIDVPDTFDTKTPIQQAVE